MLRQLLRRLGYDLHRHPARGPLHYHLETLGIDTILDVGANEGRYATGVRAHGFRGRVISFEPLPSAFGALKVASARDTLWQCHQMALGDVDGEREITVAAATEFSSFLPMEDFVEGLHPTARAAGRERVRVRTLDGLFPELRLDDEKLWLKCDTQGFERQVLEGARHHLHRFEGVQLELSLRSLYAGQPTFEAMVGYMRDHGFVLSDLLRGFSNDAAWELFEVDGLFVNRRIKCTAPDGRTARR